MNSSSFFLRIKPHKFKFPSFQQQEHNIFFITSLAKVPNWDINKRSNKFLLYYVTKLIQRREPAKGRKNEQWIGEQKGHSTSNELGTQKFHKWAWNTCEIIGSMIDVMCKCRNSPQKKKIIFYIINKPHSDITHSFHKQW